MIEDVFIEAKEGRCVIHHDGTNSWDYNSIRQHLYNNGHQRARISSYVTFEFYKDASTFAQELDNYFNSERNNRRRNSK